MLGGCHADLPHGSKNSVETGVMSSTVDGSRVAVKFQFTKENHESTTVRKHEKDDKKSGKKLAGLLALPSALSFFVFSLFRVFVFLFSESKRTPFPPVPSRHG